MRDGEMREKDRERERRVRKKEEREKILHVYKTIKFKKTFQSFHNATYIKKMLD